MHVTSSYLAQVLGITPRRVQQLVHEGVITRDAKTGKYPLPKCVQSYIDFKCAENSPRDVDYETERALHEKAKREKAELILAQMKGELHAASDVEMFMADMIVNTKNKLRGVPSRVAPLLLSQTKTSVIEDIVLTAIDESLTELAGYDPALFAGSDLSTLDLGDDEDGEEAENEEETE